MKPTAMPAYSPAASWVRWRVMGILIGASFVSYVLRANLSIAAPTMIADLGVSEIQWGWVLAAFTLGYAVFQFPGGIFSDRMGPRLALTFIAILWGILTLLTAAIPGQGSAPQWVILASLIGVRFLVGAAHAPIFPAINCSIQRWFPVGGWAFPTGLSSTGLTLGFAASAPALAWMVLEWGWRLSFLLLAPAGFLLAALWWWYGRDWPQQHPAVNAAEQSLIAAGKSAPEDSEPGAWKRVIANRDVLLLTLSYACMGFVFYDVFNWFFYYLVEIRQLGETEAGLVTASQWIVGAAGAALGGWVCDFLCRRWGLRWGCRWPVVVGMVISGLLLIGGAISPAPALALWMFIFCFGFNQLTEGAYWGASIAIGGRYAGSAGGVMNTGNNIIGVINAIAVPVIAATLGWTFAMALGGVFALVGAGLMLLVRADRALDREEDVSKG